jgi:hypothetical protein
MKDSEREGLPVVEGRCPGVFPTNGGLSREQFCHDTAIEFLWASIPTQVIELLTTGLVRMRFWCRKARTRDQER